MNPARGQGSRLIDRVSGSSQPGASPVVPNLPPRGGERGAPQLSSNCLAGTKHRVFRLLTKAEAQPCFYRVKTTDSSRKYKATHDDDNVRPSIPIASLICGSAYAVCRGRSALRVK